MAIFGICKAQIINTDIFTKPFHASRRVGCSVVPVASDYAKPEKEDKNTAATLKKTSGINTFVIISKRGGSVLYDENGKKSIYVNSLPKSVHSKY